MKPVKPGGLSTGYATKGGVFTVPVTEFVRIFSTVTVEGTNRCRRQVQAGGKRAP